MKISELMEKTPNEQLFLLTRSPQFSLRYIIDNPIVAIDKTLCFLGNFGGLNTTGMCLRTFTYNPYKEKWEVSDLDLSGKAERCFYGNFSWCELLHTFQKFFINMSGFLLDTESEW